MEKLYTDQQLVDYQELCGNRDEFLKWETNVDRKRIWRFGNSSVNGEMSVHEAKYDDLSEGEKKLAYILNHCAPKVLNKPVF